MFTQGELLRTCGGILLGILSREDGTKEQLLQVIARLSALAGQYQVWQRLCTPDVLVTPHNTLLHGLMSPQCSVIDLVLLLIDPREVDEDVLLPALTVLSLAVRQKKAE